jgi:hypothetical protein
MCNSILIADLDLSFSLEVAHLLVGELGMNAKNILAIPHSEVAAMAVEARSFDLAIISAPRTKVLLDKAIQAKSKKTKIIYYNGENPAEIVSAIKNA